jgi:hypothetical protein
MEQSKKLFLTKDEARKEFLNSEYLKSIKPQEINLRTNEYNETAYSRVELLEFYFESIMEFNPNEKNKITQALKDCIKSLKDYNENINFIKLEGSLDWNNTYVLNNTIVLSKKCLKYGHETFGKIILINLLKLKQLKNPRVYEPLYTTTFGFEKINSDRVLIVSEYYSNIITNPDACDNLWVIFLYDGLYVPLLIKNNFYFPETYLFRLQKITNSEYYYKNIDEPVKALDREDYLNLFQNYVVSTLDNPVSIFAEFIFNKKINNCI